MIHPVEDGKWGKVTVRDLALAGIEEKELSKYKVQVLEEIRFEFVTNFSYRINTDST